MKNPHLAGEGAGKDSGVAVDSIVAPRITRNFDLDKEKSSATEDDSSGGAPKSPGGNPCPHAHDCRQQWFYLNGTETADCAHCYQNLNRTDMARIIAGRA